MRYKKPAISLLTSKTECDIYTTTVRVIFTIIGRYAKFLYGRHQEGLIVSNGIVSVYKAMWTAAN